MNSAPKIAHLFLVRDDLTQERVWRQFFRGNEDHYSLYVHAKWPHRMTSDLIRHRLVTRLCPTEYGKASLVQAERLLLEAALEDERNSFFLLHSESCVPIRPFETVYRQLMENGRTWLYYFRGSMERYAGVNQRAVHKHHFYKTSQFFCLTRFHAQWLVDQPIEGNWQQCECADEHYIPALLSMCGELERCLQRQLTFTDRDVTRRESPAGPACFHKLSSADLNRLQQTPSLFARKF